MQPYYLKTNPATSSTALTEDQRRPLLILNAFRAFLAGLFCLLFLSDKLIAPLGVYQPLAFFYTSLTYFLLSSLFWLVHRNKNIPFTVQVWASAITDILILILLMHFSGGIQSGLGVLIVVTLASTSVVLGGRTALGLAALATIAILVEQAYISLVYPRGSSYPVAGLLGITYFATATLFMFLARRIRESEALARKRGIDLANLAQLTEHIIQRMQTGILVIDEEGTIRLINEAAAQMLSIDEQDKNARIDDSLPELAEQWHKWQRDPERSPEVIQLTHNPIDISPRFARIGEDTAAGALIFLQDMAAMAQHAQQLQLASLGRLSASIAHEIRNPLGAISHAGQLLAESEHLDKNDLRLTQIISDHSKRLNTIVESVMSVSRRKSSNIELINLKEFLNTFISEYCHGQSIQPENFAIEITPDDTKVRFDSGHFRQILANLCDNAIRHSHIEPGKPCIILSGGIEANATRPHLDVIDNGPGVPQNDIAHIFEPFFTTEPSGTGLGLYLSRELAEGNQAHLNYIVDEHNKWMFRLTFQDPRRQFEKP